MLTGLLQYCKSVILGVAYLPNKHERRVVVCKTFGNTFFHEMELGRTNGLDPYAGYVVDDSDLEYSECSDNDRYVEFILNPEWKRAYPMQRFFFIL